MTISSIVEFFINAAGRFFTSGEDGRTAPGRFLHSLFSEFKKDKCVIRASSLAYSSLMALIPFTALSFSLFNAFGAFSDVQVFVRKLIINLLVPTTQETILVYMDQFLENTKALGIIGLLLFTITSVLLLNKISESFNEIWGTRSRRGFIGKFTSYSSVIIFGTLFIGASFTLTRPIRNFLNSFPEIQFLLRWLVASAPSILIFMTFVLMITAIPAGKVKIRSSLIGALAGTILWVLARKAFTMGTSYAIRMSMIYGSIAVIPIFLFWLYLIWIIVFLALEISYVHQNRSRLIRLHDQTALSPVQKITAGLRIFRVIAEKYSEGKDYPSLAQISSELFLQTSEVKEYIDLFESGGLVVITDEPENRFFPSRPLNRITMKDVIKTILGQKTSFQTETEETRFVNLFLDAGYSTIGETTIEEFLESYTEIS